MAEIPQGSSARRRRSAGVTAPSRPCTSMWESRFSIGIPSDPRGQQIAFHLELALQAPQERASSTLDRDQLGHRLAALGDQDSLGIDLVEEREALRLELGSGKDLHDHII